MATLGNSPGSATQRIVTTRTATAGQTVFTPDNGYTLGYVDVILNGSDLIAGDDFTANDGLTVTLTIGANAGDVVKMISWMPRGLTDGYLKSEADAKFVQKTSATGAAKMPIGTTAERPTGENGLLRYNSTTGQNEIYQNGVWNSFTFSYEIQYLAVGGGGGNAIGAGGNRESGSGAGGLLQVTKSIVSGSSYPVVVGAGGSGHANGSSTTFAGTECFGGGFGGNVDGMAGAPGGSGGGGWYGGAGGAGTAGQGNSGGTSGGYNGWTGGGGGGAGGAGGVGTGGPGLSSSISGAAVTYAAGGGGNTYSGTTVNASGASNTGNGASGIGNGGSGIVIIKYLGTPRATGGTITQSGGYTIHTFTSSGTFTA